MNLSFIIKDNAASALYPVKPAGIPDMTEKVAAPAITCTDNVVTMTTSTEGASIHYTTDGSTPTTASTLYTGPVTITETTTFTAYATKIEMADSDEVDYVAEFKETATVSADCVNNVVTMTAVPANASIYYTTDGSTPTTASTLYTGPVTITATTNYKIMAVDDGYFDSAVVDFVAEYVAPVVETPTDNV